MHREDTDTESQTCFKIEQKQTVTAKGPISAAELFLRHSKLCTKELI